MFKREVIESIPAGLPVSVEREVFPRLLVEGSHVHAHVDHAYWRDMGTPEAIDAFARHLKSHPAVAGGGAAAARTVAESTRLFQLAESLGGIESLMNYPAEMTHASVRGTPLAVPTDLVRLSVGIEDVADLQADLEAGLECAARVAAGRGAPSSSAVPHPSPAHHRTTRARTPERTR